MLSGLRLPSCRSPHPVYTTAARLNPFQPPVDLHISLTFFTTVNNFCLFIYCFFHKRLLFCVLFLLLPTEFIKLFWTPQNSDIRLSKYARRKLFEKLQLCIAAVRKDFFVERKNFVCTPVSGQIAVKICQICLQTQIVFVNFFIAFLAFLSKCAK